MSLLAETSVLLNDTDAPPVLYELLLPWAALNAADYFEGTRGAMSRYLGQLARATGHPSEATRHFEDALEMNERMGARPWLARSQHDYGRMLLARDDPGDRERSELLLSEAKATFRELGMPVPAG